MNGFERINNVLHYRTTDVVPVMLHNFMFAAREAGMTMQEFRSNPNNMARAFVDSSVKYGLDGILTDMDTALEAHALGAKTNFFEDIPAKVIAPAADRLEDVIEMVTLDKLEQDERVKIYLEAIHLIREKVGGDLFIRGNADLGPFSLAASVYGLTKMMMDMMDREKEELILKLIERCYDVHLAFHLLVKKAGADMTSFGDSMASPDLISPKMYRKFAKPFQKRLVEDLKQHGIQTVCHICGKTDLILELMAENHFSGVEIDYKTNIAEARRLMNHKSIVFGVIDPSGVFCYGTVPEVELQTQLILDLFQGVGIVPGAGCALPAETPPENVRAFVNTVRKYPLNKMIV